MVESSDLSKVKPVWIEELKDKIKGYFGITMHDMINHLCNHEKDVKTYNKAALMEDTAWACCQLFQ